MALDLPEPDPTRLPGSPLELVVCEIRFEANLSVGTTETALSFHEAIGGTEGRYAKVEPLSGQTLNVTVGAAPTVESKGLSGWRFLSDDGAWTVSLMPEHVSLETSKYTVWEEFRDCLQEILKATGQEVSPAFEQRIGLRYIDRIKEFGLRSPQEWEDYITPELLGVVIHPQLGPAIRNAHQQILMDLGDGLSCALRHGFVVETNDEAKVDYLLDYDLFREGGRRFDIDELTATADQLNHAALQLFQASVTSRLLEQFRQS